MIKKIINNKVFAVSFLLLLLISTFSASAMNAFKSKFSSNIGWKTAAAATLAGGCTLAHYGLTFYPFSRMQSIQLRDSTLEGLDDVSPIVAEFVTNHLGQQGFKDDELLKIKKAGNFAASLTRNHAWVLVAEADLINEVLCTTDDEKANRHIKNQTTQRQRSYDEYLIEAAAILNHEAGHLLRKDFFRSICSATAVALTIEAIGLGLKKQFGTHKNYWLRNLLKIPTGAAKGYCNGVLYFALNRYGEQQADDGVQDNIHLLRGYIRNLKDEMQNPYHADHRYEVPFYRNFSTHPAFHTRIKRFKQRIKVLKQKGDSKAFENPLDIKEQEIKS